MVRYAMGLGKSVCRILKYCIQCYLLLHSILVDYPEFEALSAPSDFSHLEANILACRCGG